MSLAACIPSSFRFFSINFDRARAARSSADIAHPIFSFLYILTTGGAQSCLTKHPHPPQRSELGGQGSTGGRLRREYRSLSYSRGHLGRKKSSWSPGDTVFDWSLLHQLSLSLIEAQSVSNVGIRTGEHSSAHYTMEMECPLAYRPYLQQSRSSSDEILSQELIHKYRTKELELGLLTSTQTSLSTLIVDGSVRLKDSFSFLLSY